MRVQWSPPSAVLGYEGFSMTPVIDFGVGEGGGVGWVVGPASWLQVRPPSVVS
jgi:hypothetical protein